MSQSHAHYFQLHYRKLLRIIEGYRERFIREHPVRNTRLIEVFYGNIKQPLNKDLEQVEADFYAKMMQHKVPVPDAFRALIASQRRLLKNYLVLRLREVIN